MSLKYSATVYSALARRAASIGKILFRRRDITWFLPSDGIREVLDAVVTSYSRGGCRVSNKKMPNFFGVKFCYHMTKIKKKKSIRGYQRCFVVTATEFRLRLTQQQWWNCVCFEQSTHTHSHSRMQQLPSELSALVDIWMYWLCEVAICIFFFWQPGVSVQTSSTPFDSIRFRIPHVSFF